MDVGPKELRVQGLQVAGQRLAALPVNGVGDAVGGHGVVALGEEEGGQERRDAGVPHGGHQEVFPEVLDQFGVFLEDRVDQQLDLGRLFGGVGERGCRISVTRYGSPRAQAVVVALTGTLVVCNLVAKKSRAAEWMPF